MMRFDKTSERFFIGAMLLVLLCGFGSTRAAAQTVPDAEKVQNIRRLMQITGAGDLGAQMVEKSLVEIRVIMSSLPADIQEEVFQAFKTEVQKEFSSEKMVEMTIPIYDKHLSNEEVMALIEFYESPLGKKVIAVMPQLFAELYEEGERRGQEVGRRVIENLTESGVLDKKPTAAPPKPARKRTTRAKSRT